MLALCLALQEQTNDYPEGLKGPNVEGEYSCKWPDLLAWLQDDNLAVELSSEKKLRKNRYHDIKITFAGRAPTAFFYSRPELFKELPPPEDPKTDLRRATLRKRKNVEEINENGEENQDIIHKNVSRATVYRLAEQVSYQDLACTARDRLEVITNFNARAQVAIPGVDVQETQSRLHVIILTRVDWLETEQPQPPLHRNGSPFPLATR